MLGKTPSEFFKSHDIDPKRLGNTSVGHCVAEVAPTVLTKKPIGARVQEPLSTLAENVPLEHSDADEAPAGAKLPAGAMLQDVDPAVEEKRPLGQFSALLAP